jgi:hypothetical protein
MAPPGYPAKYSVRARELHAAGWRQFEICALLEKEFGQRPSGRSVLRWCDPDYAETERFDRAKGTALKPRQRRKMWRLVRDRMYELRHEVGLSCAAIAKLLSHDFEGVKVNEEQVRRMLEGRIAERTIKRLLWPRGAES